MDDKVQSMDSKKIARLCHEANRSYCQSIGDNTQPRWQDAPEWQKQSAMKGVALHANGDHGPEASHNAWMAEKKADGWRYGEVKDPERKEHPCMVAFSELPTHQQFKDVLFRSVVHAALASSDSQTRTLKDTHKSDGQIEAQLEDQAKGPRITPERIGNLIEREEYHVFAGSCMTVCCLTLANGFNTVGESACADPANFNEQIGRDLAFNKARKKIFELEGYLLKQRLYDGDA